MKFRRFGPYRRSTTVSDDAGVYAGRYTGEWDTHRPYDVAEGDYAIFLPHDCDEWIIAVGDRDHVLARAREFAESLAAAIAALEE